MRWFYRGVKVGLVIGGTSLILAGAGIQAPQIKLVGRVVDSVTNDPLVDAEVVITPPLGSSQPRTEPLKVSKEGTFPIPVGAPGVYHLDVKSPSPEHINVEAFPLRLPVSQQPIVRLDRPAVIAGKIIDSLGQPIANLPIRVFQPVYDINARRQLLQTAGIGSTDDRGDYRIYDLKPGAYYLRTGTGSEFIATRATGVSQPNRPSVFFPSTTDFRLAETIRLNSGETRPLPDIVVPQMLPTFTIRGRIVDLRPNVVPPSRAFIFSIPRNSPIGLTVDGSGAPVVIRPDGSFELGNVPAGQYWLRCLIAGGAPPQAGGGTTPQDTAARLTALAMALPIGVVEVEVADKDLDGVLISVAPSVSLRGHVTLEGGAVSNLANTLSVGVVSPSGGTTVFVIPQPPPVAVGPDGGIELTAIVPWDGVYRLRFLGVPAGMFISSVRLGTTDVLTEGLSIHGPTTNELQVVLSASGGVVAGLAVNPRGDLQPGAQVVLVPDSRDLLMRFKTAIAKSDGSFTIDGVAPGQYSLFAWDEIEPREYFDASFLMRFSDRAIRVLVQKSGKTDARVVVQPRD